MYFTPFADPTLTKLLYFTCFLTTCSLSRFHLNFFRSTARLSRKSWNTLFSTLFVHSQTLWIPLVSLLASHSWRGPSDPFSTETVVNWIFPLLSEPLHLSRNTFRFLSNFFRSTGRVSKIREMLGDFWAKVAPRAGETLENTRSFVRGGGPKERPRETQNLTKSQIFIQSSCKVDVAFAWRPLGSILDPCWHPRDSEITKTLYFTTCFDYFQALLIRGLHKHSVFYNLFDDFWAPAVV